MHYRLLTVILLAAPAALLAQAGATGTPSQDNGPRLSPHQHLAAKPKPPHVKNPEPK